MNNKKYKVLAAGIMVIPALVLAAELNYNFSSPAFSGIGCSSYVLTIKQLEDQAKTKNRQDLRPKWSGEFIATRNRSVQ